MYIYEEVCFLPPVSKMQNVGAMEYVVFSVHRWPFSKGKINPKERIEKEGSKICPKRGRQDMFSEKKIN